MEVKKLIFLFILILNFVKHPFIMKIDERLVTRKIVEKFFHDFLDNIDVDVAIAGAGPSGMIAAYYLAKAGRKVVIFEKKLSAGGGMWGGGMTFPVIVIQKESLPVLEEMNVKVVDAGDGYYTANALESVGKLCSGVIDAGAKIFNGMSVEDVLVHDDRVSGFVINWSASQIAKLHVDPLSIRARFCVDATGHDAEVCNIVLRKVGKLSTPSGGIEGEKSMCADMGEKSVVENSKKVYPGLYVAGMAANTVFGGPRMGPIFGGMLLSGKRVAELILKE